MPQKEPAPTAVTVGAPTAPLLATDTRAVALVNARWRPWRRTGNWTTTTPASGPASAIRPWPWPMPSPLRLRALLPYSAPPRPGPAGNGRHVRSDHRQRRPGTLSATVVPVGDAGCGRHAAGGDERGAATVPVTRARRDGDSGSGRRMGQSEAPVGSGAVAGFWEAGSTGRVAGVFTQRAPTFRSLTWPPARFATDRRLSASSTTRTVNRVLPVPQSHKSAPGSRCGAPMEHWGRGAPARPAQAGPLARAQRDRSPPPWGVARPSRRADGG